MKTKKEIVKDWITRYTGVDISSFGEYILLTNFQKYVDLYIGSKNDKKRVFEENNGWQIVATSSDDDVFEQVSFVNGINTPRGGTHVEYIADQIKTKMTEFLKKKKKLDVKPQIVKNQLRVFVNAFKIINPDRIFPSP